MGEIKLVDKTGVNAPLPATMVQAGINFNLLKLDLVAAFQKDADGYALLVMPTDNAEKSEGMTIGEIITEINGLISGHGSIEEEDITGQLEAVSEESGGAGFDPAKLRIILHQVFLYFRKNTGSTTHDLEYAFSLELVTKDMFGEKIGVIGIDDVFVSVWNTDKQKVLERMKMFNMNDFLKYDRQYEVVAK